MVWQTVRKKSETKRSVKKKVVELHPPDEEQPDETLSEENSEKEVIMDKNKDLNSGMELLEMDFLLGVVENTTSGDQKDVTMRRLNFNELMRRNNLDRIDSHALAVYVVNAGDPYGKEIQCEATKELARRTSNNGSNGD
ncbi:MAG: hypothetical protein ACYTE8_08035 [Planctomycetota bacterium]|jgi:hypothetical protein